MGASDAANSGGPRIDTATGFGLGLPKKPGDYGYIPGAAGALPMPTMDLAIGVLGLADGAAGLIKAGPWVMGKIGGFFGKDLLEQAPLTIKPGEFSISDWSGYPSGVPKPTGPFRLLEGQEYQEARDAANSANKALRKDMDLVGQKVDIHEVQPVKFNGSPTDSANKIVLDRDVHRQQVTPWWNSLQRTLETINDAK